MGKRGRKFIIDVVRETIFGVMFVVSSVGLMSEFLKTVSAAPAERPGIENLEFLTIKESDPERNDSVDKSASTNKEVDDAESIKYQECAFFQQ